MISGIGASLIGAIGQAINYQCIQHSHQKYALAGINLLVSVHIAMGLMSAAYLTLGSHWHYLDLSLLPLLVKTNIAYLMGQYAVAQAIRYSTSSIVSPLLSIKVPILALIALVLYNASFSAQQWSAMGLIFLLALYISSLAGRIRLGPLAWITLGCFSYGFSDLGITEMSSRFSHLQVLDRVMLAVAINYWFAGMLVLPMLVKVKRPLARLYQARWVALTWFASVIFLVIGFDLAGVVEANTIQSLRGVFGVLIAFALLCWQGQTMREQRRYWGQKMLTAALMVASVYLFYA